MGPISDVPAEQREGVGIAIRRTWLKLVSAPEIAPLALLLVLSAVFQRTNPAFLSTLNISNFLQYVPELGIVALGMTLLLVGGELDLSVGAVFGFAPVIIAVLVDQTGLRFEVAFAIVIAICALIGFANGQLVTRFRMSSFIVTIGMMMIVRGTALYVSDGFPQSTFNTVSPIKTLLIGRIAHVGDFTLLSSLIWYLGLAALAHTLLTNTRFGNWIMATGGNLEAAKARGVATDRVKIVLFVVSSVLACVAGTMNGLRVLAVFAIAGTGQELEVIAMTVIGGTLLGGGRGTIVGTVIGVLLLRVIRNGIIMVGVPGLAYNIFIGAIIIGQMVIHSVITRRQVGES